MEFETRRKLEEELIIILNEIDRLCNENNLNYFLIGGTLLGAIRHQGFIPWDDDIDIAMPREDFDKFIKLTEKKLNNQFFLDFETTNKNYWVPFAKIKLKNTIYIENDVKKITDNCCMWVDIFPLDYTKNEKKSKLEKRKKKVQNIYSILYNKNAKTIRDFNKWYKKIVFLLLFLIPNRLLYRLRNRIMTKENNLNCNYYINFGSQYSVKKQTHRIDRVLPLTKSKFVNNYYKIPNDSDYVLKNIYGKDYMELPPIEKRITHHPRYIRFLNGEEIKYDEKI